MKRRFMFIFVTMMMLSSFCLFNSTSVSAKQQTPKLSSTKISLETGSKKTLKIKKSLVKMRKYLGSLIILKL